MPQVPDVVGLPLAAARVRLAEAGLPEPRELATAPPRRPPATGVPRVVQQRSQGGQVTLVTALFPALTAPPPAAPETTRA